MYVRCLSLIAAAVFILAVPFHVSAAVSGKQSFVLFGGMRSAGPHLSPDELDKTVPHGGRSYGDMVAFDRELEPGSILVKTSERRLYYVLSEKKAIAYSVGVGREGFTWSGTNRITRKAEWPEWRPPRDMIEREARRGRKLPDVMAGGPENPLGARALYIGDTLYRIHGTSAPWSIGGAVSSGCIRMINEEVIDLYERVEVGAIVVVE